MKRILTSLVLFISVSSLITGQRTIDQTPGQISMKNGANTELFIRSSGIGSAPLFFPFSAALGIGNSSDPSSVFISDSQFLNPGVPSLNLGYTIESQQSNYFMQLRNRASGEETYVMSYTQMIPILTKAIQEQQVLIEKLQHRIELLED